MTRLQAAREALAGAFRPRLLWVIQVAANLGVFGLFVAWLLIPVARTWQLALNAMFAIAIVVAAVAVHAGTMNYFSDARRIENPKLPDSFWRGMRHILAIGVCAVAFYLLWSMIDKAGAYQSQLPAYIRSILPVLIRRHVSVAFLESTFERVIFVAHWIAVPGLVLPFLARTCDLGFRGFGKAGFSAWREAMFSASYWIVLTGAALVGVLVSQKIMNWRPDFRTSTYSQESLSLAIRLPLACFLALSAWMLTCSLLGRLNGGQRDTG